MLHSIQNVAPHQLALCRDAWHAAPFPGQACTVCRCKALQFGSRVQTPWTLQGYLMPWFS